MYSKTTLIITSISAPNQVLASYAEASRKHGVDFIVVGDINSPADFHLTDCDFWSLERQRGMSSRLAAILPVRHYARKNLGYLVAMERGTDVIIETDDDNFPLDAFWNDRAPLQPCIMLKDGNWVNVYRYFTDALIWPRGFPLEYIKEQVPPLESLSKQDVFCPIQQGLADENPDVDAVYRLTLPLPQVFSGAVQVALGKGSWSPFNSQNTTWFKEAFQLLYIPSRCSFRMCDIWRSFVALRICWANSWGVLFHRPTVYQERNDHDLLRDFSDEIPGYLNNAKICKTLEDLDISPGANRIGENIIKCYESLIGLGLIGTDETTLLDAWLTDCSTWL